MINFVKIGNRNTFQPSNFTEFANQRRSIRLKNISWLTTYLLICVQVTFDGYHTKWIIKISRFLNKKFINIIYSKYTRTILIRSDVVHYKLYLFKLKLLYITYCQTYYNKLYNNLVGIIFSRLLIVFPGS